MCCCVFIPRIIETFVMEIYVLLCIHTQNHGNICAVCAFILRIVEADVFLRIHIHHHENIQYAVVYSNPES